MICFQWIRKKKKESDSSEKSAFLTRKTVTGYQLNKCAEWSETFTSESIEPKHANASYDLPAIKDFKFNTRTSAYEWLRTECKNIFQAQEYQNTKSTNTNDSKQKNVQTIHRRT